MSDHIRRVRPFHVRPFLAGTLVSPGPLESPAARPGPWTCATERVLLLTHVSLTTRHSRTWTCAPERVLLGGRASGSHAREPRSPRRGGALQRVSPRRCGAARYWRGAGTGGRALGGTGERARAGERRAAESRGSLRSPACAAVATATGLSGLLYPPICPGYERYGLSRLPALQRPLSPCLPALQRVPAPRPRAPQRVRGTRVAARRAPTLGEGHAAARRARVYEMGTGTRRASIP
jgi:hypothetical protein